MDNSFGSPQRKSTLPAIIKNDIFVRKGPLKPGYVSEKILCRDDAVSTFAMALQDILYGFGPSDVLLFGDIGMGKTTVTRNLVEQLESEADKKSIEVNPIYIDFQEVATQYEYILTLANAICDKEFVQGNHQSTMVECIRNTLEQVGGEILLIMDNLEGLQKGSEPYSFIQDIKGYLDSNVGLGAIMIYDGSNPTALQDDIPSPVSTTEIKLNPYNAFELQEIIRHHTEIAFQEDSLTNGAIAKIAAKAAQYTGSAREALDTVRIAGEIARLMCSNRVTEEHVDMVEPLLMRERTIQSFIDRSLEEQLVCILVTIEYVIRVSNDGILFRTITELYEENCGAFRLETVGERTIRGYIKTLVKEGLLSRYIYNEGSKGGIWHRYAPDRSPDVIVEAAREASAPFEKLFTAEFEIALEKRNY